MADPLGIGQDLHPGLDRTRAGGGEHACALDLDDADPTDVDRRQVLEIAQGRGVDALGAAGVEDGRPGRHADGLAVDRQLDDRNARARVGASGGRLDRGGRAEQDRIDAHRATEIGLPEGATRWRSRRSGPARRSRRRASPGRLRAAARSPPSRRPVRPTGDAAGPGSPPGGRFRPGTGRTVRTIRRGRTPRSGAGRRRDRPSRRRPDDARAEGGPDGSGRLEGERDVERVGPDEDAGGTAEQDRLDGPAVGHAAGQLEELAQGGPERDLVDARPDDVRRTGRTAWVRPTRSVPIAAKAAPPSSTIAGMLTSVSTLLTVVGLPNRPTSTGNGGLLRGSPRLPSIDLKSAVSSPQM